MLYRTLLVLALVAALITSVQAVQQPCIDQVKNPGFERCVPSGQPGVLVPADWPQDGLNILPTVQCSSERHHTGTTSAKLLLQPVSNNGSAPASYHAEIRQEVGLVPVGQSITLTYWAHLGGASTTSKVKFTALNNDEQPHDILILTSIVKTSQSTTDFDQYTATFLIPDHVGTRGYLTIGFETTDSSAPIHIDDIMLSSSCGSAKSARVIEMVRCTTWCQRPLRRSTRHSLY